MNKQVKGPNGRTYPWNLSGHIVLENDTRQRSSYHLRARTILKLMFPVSPICEEVPLPGTRQSLDFYLPQQRIGIEVQGEQHYKMIPFFHENKRAFVVAKQLDAEKAQWCEINNVRLVCLAYSDTDQQWVDQIANC